MSNTIQQRIADLGYKIEDFDTELLDGYKSLELAKIEIPDSLINPKMKTGFFGVYCDFIADDENSELKATIPFLRSGMSLMHCKQITNALNKNDHELLKTYDAIFSNETISSIRKYNLALLAEQGEDFEHFLHDDSITDDEIKEFRMSFMRKKFPYRLDERTQPYVN